MSDPIPIGVPLTDLRPTQMTVGFREVEIKRRQWREADEEARAKLLRRHVVPPVVGPKGRYFIVDHHHFTKALLDEKAPLIAVYIVADPEGLAKDEFWTYLDNSDWCHAYDATGNRCKLSDIPRSISELADDPFRSLVGELIRAGGCAKSSKPGGLEANGLGNPQTGRIADGQDHAVLKVVDAPRKHATSSWLSTTGSFFA
jgi:hypothetical protein